MEHRILRTVYKEVFFNILLHRVRILLQSFQKVQKGLGKNIFDKNWNEYQKNAEFFAEYKTVGKTQKWSPKKVRYKKLKQWISKSPKSALLAVYFAHKFFCMHFLALFPADPKSAKHFAVFGILFEFFKNIYFWGLFLLFRNFGAKCAPYGAKYWKMYFCINMS